MNNCLQKNKKEIFISLGINFFITSIMGVLLWVTYKNGLSENLSDFALVQMFYPAFSTIITIKYIQKEEISKSINTFYIIFMVTTLIFIIGLFISIFIFKSLYIFSIILKIGIYISSITSVIIIFCNDCFKDINLKFDNKSKEIFKTLLIFIFLLVAEIIILYIIDSENYIDIETIIITLGILPISVFIGSIMSFVCFFGEEFAWRYYLQPRFQNIFGKKIGVLILGAIWGIWHFPLCIKVYSPETPVYCIIFHIVYCMFLGIFLGFAYMKTKNLWTPILIHITNNSLASIFSFGEIDGGAFTIVSLIINIIISLIMFGPFIFAKEYKENNHTEIGTTNS